MARFISIPEEVVDAALALAESGEAEQGIGICISCGNEQGGCEPDAQHYRCEDCGKRMVFGAEEILIRSCG